MICRVEASYAEETDRNWLRRRVHSIAFVLEGSIGVFVSGLYGPVSRTGMKTILDKNTFSKEHRH